MKCSGDGGRSKGLEYLTDAVSLRCERSCGDVDWLAVWMISRRWSIYTPVHRCDIFCASTSCYACWMFSDTRHIQMFYPIRRRYSYRYRMWHYCCCLRNAVLNDGQSSILPNWNTVDGVKEIGQMVNWLRIALLLLLRTHLLAVYTLYLTQLLRFECFQHIAAIVLHWIDQHTVLMLMVVVRRQCVTVAMIAMTMPNYDRWLCVAAHFRLAQLDFIAHLRTQIHKWKHFPNPKIHMKCNSSQFHFFFCSICLTPDIRLSNVFFFLFHLFVQTKHALAHTHTHISHTVAHIQTTSFFPCRCRFIQFFFPMRRFSIISFRNCMRLELVRWVFCIDCTCPNRLFAFRMKHNLILHAIYLHKSLFFWCLFFVPLVSSTHRYGCMRGYSQKQPNILTDSHYTEWMPMKLNKMS